MTPEQREELNRALYLLANARTDRKAIFAYVDSLLAAERAAVVAECEAIAKARARECRLNGPEDGAPIADMIAAAIRKLGEKRGPD